MPGQDIPRAPSTTPLDAFLRERPDVVLMAPFMVYLLLLMLRDLFPPQLTWLASLIGGVGGMAVVFLVRKHLPPMGRPYWGLATVCALLAAAGWFYGQYFFDWIGLPHGILGVLNAIILSPLQWLLDQVGVGVRLPLFPAAAEIVDPREEIGQGALFWLTMTTRILTAMTTVAIVEELFWRGFLLRALIDFESFHRIPLGTFTLRSFLLTSLLSTAEHPANWGVSILCWFFFNALMYWKRSLMFLTVVHGLTNLFLYAWVLVCILVFEQQSAWMFL